MKYAKLLILLLSCSGLMAQADTIFVLPASFGTTSVVNDSTFYVEATHSLDQLGNSFTSLNIQTGYRFLDATGRLYRIDSILSKTGGSSITHAVELQNANVAPFGTGIVYRAPSVGSCIPEVQVNSSGISPAVAAKIANHNAQNGCGASSGGGGGTADGVATAGTYDALNNEIDVTVASPGTSFSIDVSTLAEDADIPTNVSQLTNDSGYLTTEVDGSTTNEIQTIDTARLNGTNLELSLSSDGEAVKTVDLSSLQDGTGTDDQVASEVNITDAGGYYTGTEVETALQEIGADLASALTGTVGSNQIAYGDGAGGLTSSSGLTKISGGIQLESQLDFKKYSGDGAFSIGRLGPSSPTGSGFVSLGFEAGKNATTGGGWIAIGTEAGESITTQGGVIAIGASAARGATGNTWAAIGTNAGRVATGNNWLSIGYNSALSMLSGDSWFAMGSQAAQVKTSGTGWMALGPGAAFGNLTGNNFTVIGRLAAWKLADGTTDATDFSNSVHIGVNARVGANGVSNEIVIGYQAIGNGSNTATIGNSSVTDYYLQGTIHADDFALTPTDTEPTGAEGVIYPDDSENRPKYHDGTSFRALAFDDQISTVGTNQIAYGDGAGGLTSSAGLVKITNGINIESNLIIKKATGNNTVVIGNTLSNSSGANGIAIGKQAANDVTTGTSFVAIGNEAGRRITSSDTGVFIGSGAGSNVTTSDGVVAIGGSAGSQATGSQWVAIGGGAATLKVTGNNWFAMGADAASSSTTGEAFVCIGTQASRYATTAGDYVAIGFAAGRDVVGGGNANANQSIFLGSQTKSASTSTTNEIVIGYQAEGQGSNTATIGNSSITDNYFSGTVHAGDFNFTGTFTPTGTADATGDEGDLTYDSNYIYIKTSAGWKRAALSTF